jgi:hypothetical protein
VALADVFGVFAALKALESVSEMSLKPIHRKDDVRVAHAGYCIALPQLTQQPVQQQRV